MNAGAADRLDYLVIGAGPAGLQMAYFLQQGGHDYLVLDENDGPGGFFQHYPRHRRMISVNKVNIGSSDPEFALRMDWNSLLSDDPDMRFTRYTRSYFPQADDFVRYLADFSRAYDLRVLHGYRVSRIDRDSGGFTVADENGRVFHARRIIVATGVSRPNLPDAPGIDIAEHYADVTTDAADFTDQRVLIVGKGNSAFETADNLIETASVIHVAGPNPIRLAWQSHYVGHLRAVNNNFLDTYQLKTQNAILDGRITSIEKRDDGYLVRIQFPVSAIENHYDRVIVCTGFRFDASIFADGCRPELAIDGRFPKLTPAYESVDVEGLYFAGTLTQQLDFRHSTNGFVHGFRYGARALHRILEQTHHGRPWPHRDRPATAGELATAVLDRLNSSSALWQQYGVIGDVVTFPSPATARFHEEVPVGFLAHRRADFGGADHHVVITLEYGPGHDRGDPFGFPPGDDDNVDGDCYLHPVIRSYVRGELVETLNLPDSLENVWDRPDLHLHPLQALFSRVVSEL